MNVPYFDAPPSILNKPDGSVLFECMIQANPQPEVKWLFKEKELQGDRYVTRVKKQVGKYVCTLNIKEPKDSDQGIYKVVAKNQHGQKEIEAQYVRCCTSDKMF